MTIHATSEQDPRACDRETRQPRTLLSSECSPSHLCKLLVLPIVFKDGLAEWLLLLLSCGLSGLLVSAGGSEEEARRACRKDGETTWASAKRTGRQLPNASRNCLSCLYGLRD